MFDGSLTPPLSDLSDYDDEDSNANCQNSPVLSRLQKPSTSKERSRKRKLSLNDSSPSKPTLGLREKEVKCICMASNLQLLSEEFYKASNYILYIENKVTDSLKLSDFKCTSNMKPLFNILNIFLEQFDGVKYKDEVCHLIEKLDVLCGEISLVASAGPRFLHRLLSSQFRLSVEEKCLHDCNSQDLIDWMHSFCEVNTYALNTACLARNKCKQLNVIEVLHTSGLPVLYDGDLVVRSVNRILHQLFCMVGQAYNYLKSRVSQNAVKAIMKYPPLPCDCFRDLINKCYSLVDEAEFWGMLAEIFQGCVQNIKARKNGGTVSTHIAEFEESPDVVSCFFWWIRNMTVFSSSTTHGLTTRLIRTSMSHHCDDVTLGLHILCYRDITKSCATELAAFYLLSHHFIKKLNCTFKKRHGIAQFTNNPLSAVEWLTVVRRLNTQSVTGDTMPKNSFHCFLSLLQAVVHLNQDTMWTSLKERLISTLDSAGMNKLDVTGLENFFSFVIAVVSSCPPCHIPDFMLEAMKLFNQCCIARSDYGKQITAVNGLFALMFQLAELKLTFSDLATKANKLFTQICRLLSNKSLKTDE
uniref:Uncharacterized protein n=3 Tax=Ciona intestinalis TaxID=7719 RepID=F6YYK3_CIOIN